MTPTKEQLAHAVEVKTRYALSIGDNDAALAQALADEAEAARMALRAEQCNFCDHPKDAHSPTLGCMACLGDCACDEFNKIALSKEDVKTELRAKVTTLEAQLAQAKAEIDKLQNRDETLIKTLPAAIATFGEIIGWALSNGGDILLDAGPQGSFKDYQPVDRNALAPRPNPPPQKES